MQTLALVARVVFSLAVVLVLLWFAVRSMRKNQQRTSAGVSLELLARQPLAQRSSVAVVRVGERALVLGVSEGRIELLVDKPLSEVVTEQEDEVTPLGVPGVSQPVRRAVPAARRRAIAGPALNGPLAGSALSPQTWGRALDVLREKTVRR